MNRSTATRGPLLAVATAVLLGLSGCAAMNSLDSDVSSYSQWPAGRKPTTFAYERLPSQQANSQQQSQLETAARDALAQAGFTESPDPQTSDVTVQLGARVSRYDPWPWGDPFGFYGGFGYGRGYGPWRHGGFWGPGADFAYQSPRYDREVAVLIRDRKTGQPLYESHATNEGLNDGGTTYLAAMYEAALKDFPQPAVNPRRVSIQLGQR